MERSLLLEKKKVRRDVIKANNLSQIDFLYSDENLENLKKCRICTAVLPNRLFNREIHTKGGFSSQCRNCQAEYQRKRYASNPKVYEKRKLYIERKPEIVQKCSKNAYEKNREKLLEKKRDWNKKNAAHVSAYARKREFLQKRAIPTWANLERIEAFYKQAQLLSITTGVKHSVDHIVPIKGKTVCGLHVENNLRVIPHRENLLKNNKLLKEFSNV